MISVAQLNRYELEAQLNAPREWVGRDTVNLLRVLNVRFRISAEEAVQGIIARDAVRLVPGQFKFDDDGKSGQRRDLLRSLSETPLVICMTSNKSLDEFIKYSTVMMRRQSTAPAGISNTAADLDLRAFRVFGAAGAEARIIGRIPPKNPPAERPPSDQTLLLPFMVEPVAMLPEGLVPFGNHHILKPAR